MAVVGLNDLLPFASKVKKIQTGSELLFAYELGKYAHLMLGMELQLNDVSISKELLRGEHFSFVVSNGLDVGFQTERTELADYSQSAPFFFTKTVEGVAFSSVTPEKVTYSFNHDTVANFVLHQQDRSAAYVSLVAYLIVKSIKEGVPTPKLLIDHEAYNQTELEYVDLFVLKSYGNCLLQDLVEIKYSNNWGFQPDWEAFVIQHRQRGLMNGDYTVSEKHRFLKKNFQVGDVVLLYQRTKGARGKTINQLKGCYPAVIQSFDEHNVRLSYYPIIATRMTRHMELEEVIRDFESEDRDPIYTHDDFEKFIEVTETCSLTEIGVGTCTYTETTFFIHPVDKDGTQQYLKTPEGRDLVFLSTPDTIYAVFEDRGVEYNKERFLQMHFHSKGKIPVYEEYMERLQAATN